MDFENRYDNDTKKKFGIFYTPEDVSEFMANKTKIFDDGKGIWLDPCCGLGILSIKLALLQDDPIFFIENRLIINEKDKTQLDIALSNFKEMFGVVPKSFNEDFLTFNFEVDYIIMNPPYFKYKNTDIYNLFLEKVCKISKGFISINPISFTNSVDFINTRKKILEYSSITTYHFDNVPGQLFKDAKVRVTIIVCHNTFIERKTTNLIRWKTGERKKMFDYIDENLGNGVFTDHIFYKTNFNVLKYIGNEKTINDYVVPNSEYHLYVTNSPRYFITASTEKLDRKGQIKICMKDLESYYNALIMLNSSYLYWWWRTVDSSLSLTKRTLLSLPWINTQSNKNIVDKIKNSEQNNKIYKKNAGKIQENIKHPKKLICELNSLFLDDQFISLHD
jgi:predicted RNA methylase